MFYLFCYGLRLHPKYRVTIKFWYFQPFLQVFFIAYVDLVNHVLSWVLTARCYRLLDQTDIQKRLYSIHWIETKKDLTLWILDFFVRNKNCESRYKTSVAWAHVMQYELRNKLKGLWFFEILVVVFVGQTYMVCFFLFVFWWRYLSWIYLNFPS